MANFQHFARLILAIEGGYLLDNGVPTMKGITLPVWKQYGYDKNADGVINAVDLKTISDQDALRVYQVRYWNVLQANLFRNQAVAEMFVDFAINSGNSRAIYLAETLSNIPDGTRIDNSSAEGIAQLLVQKKFKAFTKLPTSTVERINQKSAAVTYDRALTIRKLYYDYLVRINPNAYKQFHRGWYNRLAKLERPQTPVAANNPNTPTSQPNTSNPPNLQLAAFSGFSIVALLFIASNFLNQTNQ